MCADYFYPLSYSVVPCLLSWFHFTETFSPYMISCKQFHCLSFNMPSCLPLVLIKVLLIMPTSNKSNWNFNCHWWDPAVSQLKILLYFATTHFYKQYFKNMYPEILLCHVKLCILIIFLKFMTCYNLFFKSYEIKNTISCLLNVHSKFQSLIM